MKNVLQRAKDGAKNFLRRMFKAVEDDQFIKFVFDHIRNVALCALVFAAATAKMSPDGPFSINVTPFLCYSFMVIGFCLMWVNFVHGLSKFRQMDVPWVIRLFLWFSYAPLTMVIVSIARPMVLRA